MKEKRDFDGLFRATRGDWCIGDGRERRYLGTGTGVECVRTSKDGRARLSSAFRMSA